MRNDLFKSPFTTRFHQTRINPTTTSCLHDPPLSMGCYQNRDVSRHADWMKEEGERTSDGKCDFLPTTATAMRIFLCGAVVQHFVNIRDKKFFSAGCLSETFQRFEQRFSLSSGFVCHKRENYSIFTLKKFNSQVAGGNLAFQRSLGKLRVFSRRKKQRKIKFNYRGHKPICDIINLVRLSKECGECCRGQE